MLGLGNFSVLTPSVSSNFDSMDIEKTDYKTKEKTLTHKEGLLVAATCQINVHHPLFSMNVSGVGEKGLDETNFNKVTSAWAQAYKRAAAMGLGVGIYLYFMDFKPVEWNFGKCKIPEATILEKTNEALDQVGFKFTCEETGEKIDIKTCAASLSKTGRILSIAGYKSLKERNLI